MASGGDRDLRRPPLSQSVFTDPMATPRTKAIMAALSVWNEIHNAALKTHDLISTGHLNRIDRVPDGLYKLHRSFREMERRFVVMLTKVNQFIDPAHVVFFAKIFSDKVFDAGESIETLMAPHTARAAQLRGEFRLNLQDAERTLQVYEEAVYGSVATASIGQSKVQKYFLPQPHPLEYIPVAIEPYIERGPISSRESPSNMSIPLVFLRNRRSQLETALQGLNMDRARSGYSTSDTRDHSHEAELVQGEIMLCATLQRLLTNVRMMDEASAAASASGNMSKASSPLENTVTTIFRESSEMLSAFSPPLAFERTRSVSVRDDITSSSTLRGRVSSAGNSGSSSNIHAASASSNNRDREAVRVPGLLPWPGANLESSIRTTAIGSSSSTPRTRWFVPGQSSEDSDRGRWDHTQGTELGGLFNDLTSSNGRNNCYSNPNPSAFTRVTQGSSGWAPLQYPGMSLASSVADASDLGHHHILNNDHDFGFETLHETGGDFDHRHDVMMQDIMARIIQMNLAVNTNGRALSQQNTQLRDILIYVDEMKRSIVKMQEDLATLKCRSVHSTDNWMSFIPSRSGSEDIWRNLDNHNRSPLIHGHSQSHIHHDRSGLNVSSSSWDRDRDRDRDREPARRAVDPRDRGRTNYFPPNPDRDRDISRGDGGGDYDQGGGAGAANSSSSSQYMLNNQVPPGNRANNYWDNFKSYSRLNLLSDYKTNVPLLSPSGISDEHLTTANAHGHHDDLYNSSSPARRDSRGDRGGSGTGSSSAIRSSLSANFVENIGQKKRNKDQKKQFPIPGSPAHSSSSNSSARGSLNDLMSGTVNSNGGSGRQTGNSHSQRPQEVLHRVSSSSRPSSSGGRVADLLSPLPATTATAISSGLQDMHLEPLIPGGGGGDADTVSTTRNVSLSLHPLLTHLSPVSSIALETDLVSRDEFLQMSSGAGSSSSNGRSDEGGPSSTSSKRELEKFLGDGNPVCPVEDEPQHWASDLEEYGASKPEEEPDWVGWDGEEASRRRRKMNARDQQSGDENNRE